MLNVPSFSEDMLPRHFPKTKGQLVQNAVVPQPSIPGLSLLLDDDNKALGAERVSKPEPKKSFEQWKQQNKAIFADKLTTPQRKSEKKQVRFEADNQSNCILSDKALSQRIPHSVSPNLELSYYEGSSGENFGRNQLRREQLQQNDTRTSPGCLGFQKSMLVPREQPIGSHFSSDKANTITTQTTPTSPQYFRQFNNSVRSEAIKLAANATVTNDDRQCQGHCCKQNCTSTQKHMEPLNRQTCNRAMQFNGYVNERQVVESHQKELGQQSSNAFTVKVADNYKGQLTDDNTLLNIVEEQQQQILLQQSQILMQQKQNMMQQNQIFMLQRQVQQLLLRNGKMSKDSPRQPSTIHAASKASEHTTRNRIESTDTACNGATTKSSIGVMTSFVNDCLPNGIQQFNERFATTLTNQKFIENVGGFSPDEYSYKDSMLDKINDAIQNSSAMIDYKNNGNGNADGQTDINVAAQALYYETSSTNSGCVTDQKTTDRSFALYMLGMKYDCSQDDAPKKTDEREFHSTETNNENNISVNISPEIYDYLKRHGLLKQD